MSRAAVLAARRAVVKVGSSSLTTASGGLDGDRVEALVEALDARRRAGTEIILVSSGAIAAGLAPLGLARRPRDLATLQAAASVGQGLLVAKYTDAFSRRGVCVGQVLLTVEDVVRRAHYRNARTTLRRLLNLNVVPIVNENDAVATAEIKVGDNDNLSALVALLADADLLLLLTDLEGLYTADPRSNPGARLIPEVKKIDRSLRELAGGSVSGLGVGGMATKLQAADVARRAGTDVVIAAGRAPDVIRRIAQGERMGTLFPALEAPLEHRKRWIFAGRVPKGCLVVDPGAAQALAAEGKSLLPAGIISVEGDFERGDTVCIVGPAREELARGIARYGSRELTEIIGHRSGEIADRLGYTYGPVAVHRNDLILL